MNGFIKLCKVVVLAAALLWLMPLLFTLRVEPSEIGVR